jgi:hypothetical protein
MQADATAVEPLPQPGGLVPQPLDGIYRLLDVCHGLLDER